MSIQSVATTFVEMCNQGKNFEVMKTMYHPDIVSVEGGDQGGKETRGQTPVIQKSERWAAANEIHGEKVLGPYYCGPNQFAVHFSFEVTPKAGVGAGKRVTLDEVAVYTVADDKITREVFYFAGGR